MVLLHSALICHEPILVMIFNTSSHWIADVFICDFFQKGKVCHWRSNLGQNERPSSLTSNGSVSNDFLSFARHFYDWVKLKVNHFLNFLFRLWLLEKTASGSLQYRQKSSHWVA